jgi:HK97 gp10 family phage protein
MTITVDLQGLKGVEDALAAAGPKLAKRAMRKALKAGAAQMIAAAKERAPVRTGALKTSITSSTKLSPKEEVGRTRIAASSVGDRRKGPARYALFQEFGTKNQAAKPFLRPAFDAANKAASEAFTAVMAEEVKHLDK